MGRYEIVAELGRGGMGVVYKARDTELARLVALKSMPAAEDGPDPDRRKRFLQEARSASALHHPNIITIHDILSVDDVDWIVMELVEGRTLDELLEEGELAIGRAVRWGAEIADALATAHAAGIVHRDLKPGNVMIDGKDRVRVLDFGLAKLQYGGAGSPDSSTLSAPLTELGAVVGTLDYMSPEQAMGRPVDARSDIFSLGSVLYQMLTGRRPFSGETAAARIHSVVYDAPASPASLRREIPRALSEIVLEALAKQPSERFQSIAAMRDALVAVAQSLGEPLAGASRSTLQVQPLHRTRRRRRRVVLGIGAVALATAATFFWATRERAPSESAPGAAEAALPETPFAYQKEGERLLSKFWREGYVDQAIERFQRAQALRTNYAPAYAGLAEAYLQKYKVDRDTVWLERASAQARQALDFDADLTAARVSLGAALVATGDLEQAAATLEGVEPLDPSNPRLLASLAELAVKRGATDTAEALLLKAIESAPDDPVLRSDLGVLRYKDRRLEDAVAAFSEATRRQEDYVPAYTNLAGVLHLLGRYDEASEALQAALRIKPDATTYSNLGTLYFFQGLYSQSLSAFERAIDLGANDYVVWANLGDAYRWTPGRETDARRAFQRALQLLDEVLALDPDDTTLLSRRAALLSKSGNTREGAELAESLVRSSSDPVALYRCAVALEAASERQLALTALAKAVRNGSSEVEIRRDPEFESLRGDRRFHELMSQSKAGPAGAS